MRTLVATMLVCICSIVFLVGAGCSDSDVPTSSFTSDRSYYPPVKKVESARKIIPDIQKRGDCDQNYSGCVPIASDVDCAGGKGNGPAYIGGPVEVIGYDIYDLDRDGDGVGCE